MAEGERQQRRGLLTTGSGQFAESYSQLVTGACDAAVTRSGSSYVENQGKRGVPPSKTKIRTQVRSYSNLWQLSRSKRRWCVGTGGM